MFLGTMTREIMTRESSGHRGAVRGFSMPDRLLTGVCAEQPVHRVTLLAHGLDEARAGQGVKRAVREFDCRAAQGGHGARLKLKAGMQAGQQESARGVTVQLPVGPGERGADIGGWVARVGERVKARPCRKFGGDAGKRQIRPQFRPGGDDAQGKRQPGARADDLVHGMPVRAEPTGAEARRE
jgi:hypothetical protein